MDSLGKWRASVSALAEKARAKAAGAPSLSTLPARNAIAAGQAWASRHLGPLDGAATRLSARLDETAMRLLRTFPVGGGLSSLYDAPGAAAVPAAAAEPAPAAVAPAPSAMAAPPAPQPPAASPPPSVPAEEPASAAPAGEDAPAQRRPPRRRESRASEAEA
jgi:hypothetical protein